MTDYPKVSVVTITYGHEDYITQTLDGVLMQNYPGEIEFIIANDNSPDATDEVIKDYFSSKQIPENFTIKYTKHEINKGMMRNFVWGLDQVSGKYIALCEGDDYWTDSFKLQKQVTFLENQENFSMHFHSAKVLTEDGISDCISYVSPLENKIYTGREILNKWLVPTASVTFRKEDLTESVRVRLLNSSYMFGDIIVFLSMAEKGYLFGSSEMMSVYRRHNQGIFLKNENSRNENAVNRKFVEHHLEMAKDFGGFYKDMNYSFISNAYFAPIITEKNVLKKIIYIYNFNKYMFFSSKKSFFSIINFKTNILQLKRLLFRFT